MSDLHAAHDEVTNAALAWLLSRPGSGRRDIPGHVLRYAFRERGLDYGNRVINACVPALIKPADASGNTYFLTLEGLLRAADQRPRKVLATALALISERYHAGQVDQRMLLWSDLRRKGAFASEDFDVAWHTILIANISGGGRSIPSSLATGSSVDDDYDFWLKESDLEMIAYHATVDEWLKVQSRMSEPRVQVSIDASPTPPLVESRNTEIVFARDAIVVMRNGLRDEKASLDALRAEAKVLLGREVEALARHSNCVDRMFEKFHLAQSADAVGEERTEESLRSMRVAHHWIATDLAKREARNAMRRRLGVGNAELIGGTERLDRVSNDLAAVLGGPLKPRTLMEWIGSESTPQFELLRKACVHFIHTGSWLRVSGERRARKERDLNADVDGEIAALSHYCRVEGDRVIPRLEAFVLFSECAPYIEGLLALIRRGIARFLEGAAREPDGRPGVSADDLAEIVGSLPIESFRRFVEYLSALDGSCEWSPFSWVPSRRLLRFYPATTADDLVAADGLLGQEKHALPEESLAVLRVVADTWMKTYEWPTLDALLVDDRLGPQYVFALTDLNFTWIKSPDYRTATLDVDGLILGASEGVYLANVVARVVGMLADKLDDDRGMTLAEVAQLTGVDIELLRHLLPMLRRSDLGLSVLGESTPNMEVRSERALVDYIHVRSVVELSARWPRNRERHPEYSRATDADSLNVFAVATMHDRIKALGGRDRKLSSPDGLDEAQDRAHAMVDASSSDHANFDIITTESSTPIASTPRAAAENDRMNGTVAMNTRRQALDEVVHLLERFSVAAHCLRVRRKGKEPLLMENEYDVQYLLHALLLTRFDDVRAEDSVPSHAGAPSRVDFLLKEESIIVEAKMTRDGLADKEVGEQLLIDIARYSARPDCAALACLVYDPKRRLRNAVGLTRDLEQSGGRLKVRVIISH